MFFVFFAVAFSQFELFGLGFRQLENWMSLDRSLEFPKMKIKIQTGLSNIFVLIQLTNLRSSAHTKIYMHHDRFDHASACTTLPKAMFQAMELIDISSPAARKSLSTVTAHLGALDRFLQHCFPDKLRDKSSSLSH